MTNSKPHVGKTTLDREYSKTQVNKAGYKIIYALTSDSNRDMSLNIEQLNEPFKILNYWRSCHAYPINTFQATLRNKLNSIDRHALVAQRLKRLPSIIKKLRKMKGMQLARMHDIGGLRAVTSSLKKVKELEKNYRNTIFAHSLHRVDDYIENPKPSGYRSIHLVYKYKNNKNPYYDGLFVELQIRTKVQHAWATAVETVEVVTYPKKNLKEANSKYTALEKKASESKYLQVVLVSAGSVKNLRAAYPSYFLDSKQFLRHINNLKDRI